MNFPSSIILVLVTTSVEAFQPANLFGNKISRPEVWSFSRAMPVYTQSKDSAVLEDVDGLGAAGDKKNLTLSRVEFDSEKQDELQDDIAQLLIDVEEEASKATQEIMDEECDYDDETGGPTDDLCFDGKEREGFRVKLKKTIGSTLKMIRGMPASEEEAEEVEQGDSVEGVQGDLLEQGWNQRGGVSALRRNAEVWKFSLKAVFRALKPRSLRKKGASEDEVKQAQIEAAEFIRDGLLTLGPTFVKLGQVSRRLTMYIVQWGMFPLIFCVRIGCLHEDRCPSEDIYRRAEESSR